MNYQNLYNRITENARSRFTINSDSMWSWRTAYNRENPSDYRELHHITPKGIGGLDVGTNYCMLTPREHFIVHKLLTKIHPTTRAVIVAFFMMSHMKNKYNISVTAREYEVSKVQYNKYTKGIYSPSTYLIGTLNHFYGKHHTKESIERANITRSKNVYAMDLLRSRMRQMSKENVGDKNHMYGNHHNEQTKAKLWKSNIVTGKCKPLLFHGNIFLSTHTASRLLNEHRSCITRYIKRFPSDNNKFLTPDEFFGKFDADRLLWQFTPTEHQIAEYTTEYKRVCSELEINENIKRLTHHRTRSIEIVSNYVNGSFDNLTAYANSIDCSTTQVNNYFRMFPLYKEICIPNKPFTRHMAQLLLNNGLPENAVLPYVIKSQSA